MSAEARLKVGGHRGVLGTALEAIAPGSKPPMPATNRKGTDGGRPIPAQMEIPIRSMKAAKAIGVPMPLDSQGD